MAGRATAVAAHEEEAPQREAAALVNVDVARVEAAARLRTREELQLAVDKETARVAEAKEGFNMLAQEREAKQTLVESMQLQLGEVTHELSRSAAYVPQAADAGAKLALSDDSARVDALAAKLEVSISRVVKDHAARHRASKAAERPPSVVDRVCAVHLCQEGQPAALIMMLHGRNLESSF